MIRIIFSLIFLFVTSSVFAISSASLLHHPGDPVVGNKNAPVTVMEFFDYQCVHCTKMTPSIDAIIKSNPRVRFVFKELPIKGPASEFATRVALAAGKQGKYYQMYKSLMTTNLSLTKSNVLDIAKSMGLNMKRLMKDVSSNAMAKQIGYNYDVARSFGITGTPAFIVAKTDEKDKNKMQVYLGELSKSELQDAISQLN